MKQTILNSDCKTVNSNTVQLEVEGRLQQRNRPSINIHGTNNNRTLYLKPFQSQIIYALLDQIAKQSPKYWNIELQQHKYVDFTPSSSFKSCPCISKQIQQVRQSDHRPFDFNSTSRARMPIIDSERGDLTTSLVELLKSNASQTSVLLTRKTHIDSFSIPQPSTGTLSSKGLEIKLVGRMEHNCEILLPVACDHPVWASFTGSTVSYRISQRTILAVDGLEISLTTTTTFATPDNSIDSHNAVPKHTTHILEVELAPSSYLKIGTPEQMRQQCAKCIAVLQSFQRIIV
jgi:hypothetical protein